MYNSTTGDGYGNIFPWVFSDGQGKVEWISLVRFWTGNIGYERWMGWGQTKNGHIEYYYPVTAGKDEVISLGQKIAEMANGGGWNSGIGLVAINPNGGEFADSVEITLTTTEPGLVIYYTTDGKTPNRDANKYVDSFVLTHSTTVKARAYTLNYQDSTGITGAEFKMLHSLKPESPSSTAPGVQYKYYEGTWHSLPDFDKLAPKTTGVVDYFKISSREQNDHFGFEFEGYIAIEKAGTYNFYTESDAGSQLYIQSHLIVDNDELGLQADSGKVKLEPGFYSIRVIYFEDTGYGGLVVMYSGPGITKKQIPASVLSHANGTSSIVQWDGSVQSKVIPRYVAKGQFVLRLPPGKHTVSLYRLDGSLVFCRSLGDVCQMILPMDRFQSGMYLLSVGGGTRFAEPLLILK